MTITFSEDNSMLFEVLERAIRLHSHIDRSCKVAKRPGARTTAQIKIAQEALCLLTAEISDLIHDFSTGENLLENLHIALSRIADIHLRVLGAVPRPHEPIELISYLRQTLIGKEIPESLKSSHKGTIFTPEVFATELLGDQAHDRYKFLSPVSTELEKESRKALSENTLSGFAEKHLSGESKPSTQPWINIGYVSLPRIDLGNPCRWPSLMHEVGHFYIDKSKLWNDFSQYLADIGVKEEQVLTWIGEFSSSKDIETTKKELRAWLEECWCDAFAVTVAGPSVFFAQMHAYLFSKPCYINEPPQRTGKKYPPAWFRLKLILSLAETRFSADDEQSSNEIYKSLESEKKLIYKLFSVNTESGDELFQLVHIFRGFLKSSFPREKYLDSSDISSETLHQLKCDLEMGFPIPAVENFETKKQRAATPSEILLAGWIHRGTKYKEDFLNTFFEWMSSGQDKFVDEVIEILRSKVDRADESLKRSLQMAEWFKILDESAKLKITKSELPGAEVEFTLPAEHSSTLPPGLLSDVQIHNLLNTRDLRIIPLIDFERQVSGTVIDLRLGHNFEIFFTNVHGAVDPLQNSNNDEVDSMEMDVDFLRKISIGPGQFLLGHTLEYLKLPNGIAAQIEGRSSFARLGLQIHMTANLVEAGFDGCLTLEIANTGHSTIILYPGMRIAQLRFFKLISEPKHPYGAMRGNKYRGLLSHNKTRQFSDWEVDAFEKAGKLLGIELSSK